MFSDDNTFTMVRGVSKVVHRPRSASRYDLKFTVETMKHPGSEMVRGVSVEIWARLVCTSLLKMYQ